MDSKEASGKHSTPDLEAKALELAAPHAMIIWGDNAGDICSGEPRPDHHARPGDCACGALRRRQLIKWMLDSANANGSIKTLTRMGQIAARSETGYVMLREEDYKYAVAVNANLLAQGTGERPEWLQKLLLDNGLAI